MIVRMLIAVAVQATAPVTDAKTQAAEPEQPSGTPLWRDLRTGMTVEETGTALRSVAGVKSVKVKMKKRIPNALSINYLPGEVKIADQSFTLTPMFVDGKLHELALINEMCLEAAIERAKLLRAPLHEKYGNVQTENVVDEKNVRQNRRFAYWNDDTRVRLELTLVSPPALEYSDESAGGLAGSLAALANSLNRAAVSEAMNACPKDAGYKMRTTVTYSSQAVFLVEHKAETDERDAKAQARKEAL